MSASVINDYFIHLIDESKVKCKVCDDIMTPKSFTMERHLKRKHEEMHKKYRERKLASEKSLINKRKLDVAGFSDDKKQRKIDDLLPVVNRVGKVTFSEKSIRSACIEMVTKNQRPFSIVNDTGFQKILKPIINAIGCNINEENLKEFVLDEAEKIESVIRQQLEQCE